MTEKEPENIQNKMILDLFQQNDNRKDLSSLLDDVKSVPMGMTEFQINHFVLNGIEYPTDWSKFQQTKLQLHMGIQSLVDMYFQLQEAQARIELAHAEITTFSAEKLDQKRDVVGEAKMKLKRISIEKNEFKIISIKTTAAEKLREIMAFYTVFRNLKELDSITDEDSKILEEQTWKIRSMYTPEFKNRYGLTPEGFLKLPHEMIDVLSGEKLSRKQIAMIKRQGMFKEVQT